MFTGIIMAVGRVASVQPTSGGVRLHIDAGGLALDDVAIGDSIAVNGTCLTAIAITAGGFDVDLSRETLACVAGFAQNARVNLEKALRLADRLGGHLVSGHVDGIGAVSRVDAAGDNRVVEISVPPTLAKYIARKGSIALDGVSLTVNEVTGESFSVNLIPHTLSATNLAALAPGLQVNIEVDMLARYVERILTAYSSSVKQN
jgi:riboflavin synthase